MTCKGCCASVSNALKAREYIDKVSVDLESGMATIEMSRPLLLDELQSALSSRYHISEQGQPVMREEKETETSKWHQLRPLFLIFIYLVGASILLNYKAGSIWEGMLDFMGLFFIVFSFFKFLDLNGFQVSFAMYDPLANAFSAYGWIYPFLEGALGLLFLLRLWIVPALILTIVILSITTIGVSCTLLDKRSIKCACLGTALNLPMTEATFIENAVMLIMAGLMLLKGGLL